MPNYALLLEYNGKNFHGWQKQPSVRTIQEELQKAIEVATRNPIKKLTASGRTDSGVHAKNQVVNFFSPIEIDLKSLPLAISSILKYEVSVLKINKVVDEFDACRWAQAKTYRYVILNRSVPPVIEAGFCWHVTSMLDIEELKKDANFLIGEQDFTSFRASGCGSRTPVKTIHNINIKKSNNYVYIEIRGSGFLKQMVRNIVGTLVDLQQKKININMSELINKRDRTLAGRTAPAQGLFLMNVEYELKIF
ncbi:UNVERIFIED_CONTAM: hypothetical protein GTU68_029475 [Idotea baltica]|nr:hypothetical protein [Idotea baltica]